MEPVTFDDQKMRAIELENRDGDVEHSATWKEDAMAAPQIDPVVERKLLRKIDFRLIPLVMFLYLLAYLDRSNIGNAKIAGMSKALHLSSNDYTWLLTIFYISYILFEPMALMWKILPPHVWAACMVFSWSLSSTLQAAAFNWSGMMAARFFLGAFEASFAPGIPYLLSFFYLRKELGVRIGFFLSMSALSTCFAGALAYGITSGNPKIGAWRVLFLVEGIPGLIAAVGTWFLMPDSADTAKFLTPEEREVAKARARVQVGDSEEHRSHKINWGDVGRTLLDAKAWIYALMYFSCNVSFSSLPVFLPTILQEMGFTAVNAQGLSAPPYFIAFLVTVGSTYLADKTQQRGLTVLILSFIGAVGYIMLATTKGVAPRYAGVFLAAAGIFPSIGNILPWVLNNQGSDTRRGTGIAILNLVGQCGPILGTRLYPANESPYYRKGMWVCAGFMLFVSFLSISLRLLLMWENKRLDAKYGPKEDQPAGYGEENEGPRFRYVL